MTPLRITISEGTRQDGNTIIKMNNIDKDKLLHFFWNAILLMPLVALFGSLWGCVLLAFIGATKEIVHDLIMKKADDPKNLKEARLENLNRYAKEVLEDEQYKKKLVKVEETEDISAQVDKISSALPRVSGLGAKADQELDDIADKAMSSYEDLMDLGMNAELRYSGRIFEVAGGLLKTSLDAKVAKMDKKLKMLDAQIKKQKLDQGNVESSDTINGDDLVIDRNALLGKLKDIDK